MSNNEQQTTQLSFNNTEQPQFSESYIIDAGSSYLIPAVFTKEGIHNNKFKPYQTIKNTAPLLKGIPIVTQNHPQTNGTKRAINRDTDNIIGTIEYAEARDTDKSVHGTIRIHKTPETQILINQISRSGLRGGSLGYYAALTPQNGTHNGKTYTTVEDITAYDHYVIGITDPAAKVEDGCGLLFNTDENNQIIEENIMSSTDNDKRLTKLEELLIEQKKEFEKREAEWKTILEDLTNKYTTSEAKIKEYANKEAAITVQHHASLVKEITEGTDIKPEVYKDFTTAQLELVKSQIVSQQKLDAKNYTPQNSSMPAESAKPKADNALSAPVQQAPPNTGDNTGIGNSLFGKPMGVV